MLANKTSLNITNNSLIILPNQFLYHSYSSPRLDQFQK